MNVAELIDLCSGKRVALDCDGVLSDFKAYILTTVGSTKDPATLRDYKFETLCTAAERNVARLVMEIPGWWRQIPIIDHAGTGVDAVRAVASDLIVVTAPWYSCVGWETARREWLYSHFGIPRKDVLVATRKELVHADVMIEDRPENLEAWCKRHPDGIGVLFDRSYNQDVRWPLRLYGWK